MEGGAVVAATFVPHWVQKTLVGVRGLPQFEQFWADMVLLRTPDG